MRMESYMAIDLELHSNKNLSDLACRVILKADR